MEFENPLLCSILRKSCTPPLLIKGISLNIACMNKNHAPLTYKAITRQIEISVRPLFLEDQSVPDEDIYVWAYTVRIDNKGGETVQLLTRHWHITNARGERYDVEGDGVVGETPLLEPGDHFEYTSGTPLATPSGLMHGTYTMENERGERFDVTIPAFSLDSPYQPVRLN